MSARIRSIEAQFERLVDLNQRIIEAPLFKKAAVGIELVEVSMRLTRDVLDMVIDQGHRIHKLERSQ